MKSFETSGRLLFYLCIFCGKLFFLLIWNCEQDFDVLELQFEHLILQPNGFPFASILKLEIAGESSMELF